MTQASVAMAEGFVVLVGPFCVKASFGNFEVVELVFWGSSLIFLEICLMHLMTGDYGEGPHDLEIQETTPMVRRAFGTTLPMCTVKSNVCLNVISKLDKESYMVGAH